MRRYLNAVIALAVLLPACDAYMNVGVAVRDRAGVAVEGATVQLAVTADGREVGREKTNSQGRAEVGNVYGFRSAARRLSIQKDHYKAFSTSLQPRRGYLCEVILGAEAEPEPSEGRCVGE